MNVSSRGISAGWRRSMFWTLAFFTLGSMVVILIGEAFKTHLIWYIRFADFVDLVIIAPLYLITLLLFQEKFAEGGTSRALGRLFWILAVLYLYGHAMHLTANAIDTFSFEIRDYRQLFPDDTYDLIYFLDETLSHLIVFIVRYALFGCLLALEARYLSKAGSAGRAWPAILVGALYGLWEAIVFTEGQKVWLLPILVLVLGGVWLWLWRGSNLSIGSFFRQGPVTAFAGVLVVAALLGMLLYWAVTGGFAEPSETSWIGHTIAVI